MRHARRAGDRPVFVDRSGRRRRLVRLAGASLGAALAAVLALLLAAMSGASPVRVPGFPDPGRNAGGVDATTPAPPRRPDPPDSPAITTVVPPPSTGPAAAPTQTVKRRIPTHTPDHPQPSKTR
jgi:hypothetical protein